MNVNDGSPCPLKPAAISATNVPQRGQLVPVGESGIPQREHLIENIPLSTTYNLLIIC
ncbi:MAG: hypothetical protein NVS9B9_16600 [Ktedonobacteraceae bacterium]